MAYDVLPAAPGEFDPAPASSAPPAVGPKNVYKSKASYTLPDITEADLPDIDIGEPAAAAKPAPKPMPVAEGEEFVPQSEVYDPKSDYALTRGIKTAFRGMGEGLLTTAAMAKASTMSTGDLRQWMLDRVKARTDPRNAQLQEPSFTDVESLGEGATYLGESAGQVIGSLLGGATYGGLPGAAVGGAVGSVAPGPGTLAGAGVGFTAGTGAAFIGSGPGSMLDSALEDEGVQKAIADGTLDPHKLLGVTAGSGTLIGAIDAFPATKWIMKVGGKEVSKEAVKVLLGQAIKKGLVHGMRDEAGTEALQQTIDETTQALAGGDLKLAERGLNVLNAGIVGAVGGGPAGAVAEVGENARIPAIPAPGEEEDKGDEHDAANPATLPGVVATDTAGTNSPGNIGAAQPGQPAGAPPGWAPDRPWAASGQPGGTPDDIDPAIKEAVKPTVQEGAGPLATPTDRPVIDDTEGAIPEEDALPADDATAAQQTELARVTRELLARQQAEDAARQQEKVAETPVVEQTAAGDVSSDVKVAVAATEKPKRKPRAKKGAPVVAADVAAETAIPEPETPAPETPAVDTGDNITIDPGAQVTAETTPTTEEPAGVPASPPAVEQAAQPFDKTEPSALGTPVPLATAPLAEQAKTLPDQTSVAAFTPAAPEAQPVAAGEVFTPLTRADQDEITRAVRSGEEIPGSKPVVIKAQKPKAEPTTAAEKPVEVEKPLTRGELIKQRAREADLARAKATTEGKPAAVGPKGKLAIAGKAPVSMVRKGLKTLVLPKPTAVTAERAGEVEVAERPAEAAPAPAAAPAAEKARRREVSEQVASEVRADPSLDRTDGTSPLLNLPQPLVHKTISDVAAEFAEREPAGQAASVTIRNLAGRRAELMAEVERRLEGDVAAYERESRSLVQKLEDKKTERADAKAAAESGKRAEQAKATQGSKKERISKKGKGLSPEGLKEQSFDSIQREGEIHANRVPKRRDPLVLQHAQIVREIRSKETTEQRRAELAELEQTVRDQRIAKAEAAREAGPGLSEEHQEVEAAIEEATKDLPLPDISPTDTTEQQNATAREHLAAFLKAIEGIKVAGRHDRVHNSPLENLAVFAHKLRKKDADTAGLGAGEFWNAQQLMEDGALEDFTNLVTNEKIKGSELREETTGEEGDALERLEEGESVDRKRPQEEEEPSTETVPFMRTGRAARTAARRAEDIGASGRINKAGQREKQMLTASGEVFFAPAATHRARDLLSWLSSNPWTGEGFMSMLRSVLIRHLKQLVGDVQVHYVSRETLDRIDPRYAGYTQGFYVNYSDKERNAGWKPEVFLFEDLQLEQAMHDHILLHELVHAATSMAITRNLRGINAVITPMRTALEQELRRRFSEQEMRDMGIKYAFADNQEFIAEAMTNTALQELMAEIPMSAVGRRQIGMIARGRMPSWWDLFVRAVSDAVGMIRGRRGQSYMEQVLRVYQSAAYSSAGQQRIAEERETERRFGKGAEEEIEDVAAFKRALPNGPADVAHFTIDFKRRVADAREAASSGWQTRTKQALTNALSTTGQMQRRAAEVFGSPNNPFTKLSDFLLKKDPLRAKYRESWQPTELKLLEFKRTARAMYDALANVVHEASRFGIDPMVGLDHANNKHVSKTGERGSQRRKAHAKWAAEWAKLSPEAQALGREAAEHYRAMHKAEARKTVTHAIRSALGKYRVAEKLKAIGKTEEDAVNWVLSKAAVRLPEEQTAEDKAFHDALGETAKTIANVPELKEFKGLYFPLTRRGKWFVTATEKLATPAGAVADPSSLDGNRFLFTDKKKFNEFQETTDYVSRPSSYWVNPLTYDRTEKTNSVVDPKTGQLVHPVQVFVATVQNKHLIMHDNRNVLKKQAEQLAADGHKVSATAATDSGFEKQMEDYSPSQLKSLLNNVKQTTIGSTTIGQQVVKNAIIETSIRAMTRPSALTRRLKRKGTMGYDTDLAGAMREYNQSSANHFANLDMAHDMAEAQGDLSKFIEDRRKTGAGTDISDLQAMQKELNERIESHAVDSRGVLSRVADVALNMAYQRHLFSPHYTIMQMIQPFMTTYPMLAAQYGHGAAWRQIVMAYKIMGVKKTLGAGMTETWNAARNLNPYRQAQVKAANDMGMGVHDKMWFDGVANEADGQELQDVILGNVERGWGASSGIEAAAISEQDLTKAEVALNRVTDVAKGLPEAAEGINRYSTLISAYRLARLSGDSIADAQRKAWLSVEQTQGGYARANNPRMFQHRLAKFPLQFHKYGLMYAQMYYGNLTKLVAKDPETRKVAAKALARLSATTFIFAGVGGLPFIEVARMLANTAVMMGMSDDDWEDWESDMQEWFASLIGGAPAEALTHGLTRIAGIDTSNVLGADNLLTFGQPKTLDEEGTKSWLFDALILGAAGSMGEDMAKALGEGDIMGALPWPKIMDNLFKAYGLYSEGTVSKTTGEQYAEPVNLYEAGIKALGFQPASSSRQWETGGGGRAAAEERQLFHQRNKLFDKWNLAKNRGNTAEAQRVFQQDVREWNQSHRDKKFRIDMGDLMRSKKDRERERKERQRALQ